MEKLERGITSPDNQSWDATDFARLRRSSFFFAFRGSFGQLSDQPGSEVPRARAPRSLHVVARPWRDPIFIKRASSPAVAPIRS